MDVGNDAPDRWWLWLGPQTPWDNAASFFELAFRGQEKIIRTSALASSSLNIVRHGQFEQRRRVFVYRQSRQCRRAKQRSRPLGAACATSLVGCMLGIPLGGHVGGLLIILLGLASGLCLGVSSRPISPLRVPSVDGLLDTGLIVRFDAVVVTCSGLDHAPAIWWLGLAPRSPWAIAASSLIWGP